MKKLVLVFIAILVIAMATVGCSKATATGPSTGGIIDEPYPSTATVTETSTVDVLVTATSTATETPEGTVVATNTATEVPTPAATATPLTQVYVRVIVENAADPLIMGSADVSITCGGYVISGVGMTLPYDSSFSSMSNQGVIINTSSPGVPTRVRIMISDNLSDLTDVGSTAYMFPFVDATGEEIETDLIPFSYQY
jgi:hypothetical protein